jgi:hypothetical protein
MKRGKKAKPPERRRHRRPRKPSSLRDVAAEANSSARKNYETNVAPDVIDADQTPDRLEAADSECSLPARYVPDRARP